MATVTVTITGSPANSSSSGYRYVTIDGTKLSTTGTYTYSGPKEITVTIQPQRPAYGVGDITYNGESVGGTGANYQKTYTFEAASSGLDTNVTINFKLTSNKPSATITTEEIQPPEPEPEHFTNIGGVAGEIESGTVLFGGAAYEIESGTMLSGGVAYEIPFGSKVVTVNISGTPHSSYAYVTISGTKYSTETTYEGEKPLEISVYVTSATLMGGYYCEVSLNGETVQTGKGTYTFETNANVVDVVFATKKVTSGNSTYTVYTATITEE